MRLNAFKLILMALTIACGAKSPGDSSPAVVRQSTDGGTTCGSNYECLLVSSDSACCSKCTRSSAGYRAIGWTDPQLDDYRHCFDVKSCASCDYGDSADAPVLIAACVQGKCRMVDLRLDESTRCDTSSDCSMQSTACCPGCGGPGEEFALASGHSFPGAPSCDGRTCPAVATRCDEGTWSSEPYCADDGHCAVRWALRPPH